MQINYPTAQPNGFGMPVSCFGLSTGYNTESSAVIRANELLFRFYNFSAEVSIEIELSDYQNNGVLTVTNFTATARGGTRFVLFSDFPQTSAGEEMSTCNFRLTVVNPRNARDGAHLDVQIFAHR